MKAVMVPLCQNMRLTLPGTPADGLFVVVGA